MPNGLSAMSSIAIGEGRAARIADYTSQNRPNTVRNKHTLRSQTAAAKAGMQFRIDQAKSGRVTHGAGGIGSLRRTKKGGKSNLKQYSKAEKEFTENFYNNAPYSKARARTAGYSAPKPGEVTKAWRKAKVPKTDRVGRRKK